MKKPTIIDLFAGIGGFRLGFEKNGYERVFSSEKNKYCQQVYEANFNKIPAGDMTNISPGLIPDFDVLTRIFRRARFGR